MSGPEKRPEIVRIDHREPLPGYREPEGRWMQPYITLNGTWMCRLRRPLTHQQERAGLLFVIAALDLDGLKALMKHEDAKAARLAGEPG
ncbi:hypothetical protein BTM25_39120 [Actinomadura rubteroloni]|uniref:Uncharacterized protein n=1 Tax=Actinomadura rubteroloni TaxID=1926885 RepID=A0A2P4UJS5_9ACTN|nr:hypothetical protein [Actinomadura rubteroloni]POM25268.1 hypothetical protein BTM25_39120 [Actinomadura rubteroloni]